MLVLSCAAGAFDSVTGECSSPVWVQLSDGFASLSVSDGAALAGGVLALWCIGAAFRWARKAMWR